MPFEKWIHPFGRAGRNARQVTRQGLGIILHDPTILAYPLLASIFVLLTYPAVSGVVLNLWHHIEPRPVIDAVNGTQQQVPHRLRDILGIVTFYYFYAAVVTSFFTVATAAAVIAKLEGRPTTFLHGIMVVARHFIRVVHFALLSIFFVPLGIIAQRRKLPKGLVGVVGSSATLHTANLAPAILSEKRGVGATIRTAINTMGGAWREGLLIKIGMWSSLLVLGAISFLPKLIQHYWFDKTTSHWIGWFASTVLLVTFFVATKVIGGVLLTVLYHQTQKTNES